MLQYVMSFHFSQHQAGMESIVSVLSLDADGYEQIYELKIKKMSKQFGGFFVECLDFQ